MTLLAFVALLPVLTTAPCRARVAAVSDRPLIIAADAQPLSLRKIIARRTGGTDDSLYYNQVVRLKDGRILVGRVAYDPETDRYTVKGRDGNIITVLNRDVEVVEQHSRVYLPPKYNPSAPVYSCDIRQRDRLWWFAELKIWLMYSGKDESDQQIGLPSLLVGPEAALGLRFGKNWAAGIGVSYFSAREISRIPLFLYGRYTFTLECNTPYAYGLLGTVFDDQSDDAIALDKIISPGPKIAGFGIGMDFALSPMLDLSIDLGYRYLQLPTSYFCDCSDQPPPREALYYNESHGLLLRAGVTF
jgi:hypothetical protein